MRPMKYYEIIVSYCIIPVLGTTSSILVVVACRVASDVYVDLLYRSTVAIYTIL